jgi:hypothetical protein
MLSYGPCIGRVVQQKTLSKIQVFGAEGWKEPLLSAVPAGILPAEVGGNKIGNNEHQICLGREVTQADQSQYQPQEITGEVVDEDDDDDPGVTDMVDTQSRLEQDL